MHWSNVMMEVHAKRAIARKARSVHTEAGRCLINQVAKAGCSRNPHEAPLRYEHEKLKQKLHKCSANRDLMCFSFRESSFAPWKIKAANWSGTVR